MTGTDVDVVVVGGGAAGLSAALAAARTRRVLVVVKGLLGDGATAWAQGGLAAAVGPGDSTGQHVEDTVAAGAGLSRRDAAQMVVDDAPSVLRRLLALGARFDTTEAGHWSLGREGGHRRSRILHAGGDRTGAEISRVLVAAVRSRGLEVIEHGIVSDLLLTEHGRVCGVELRDGDGRSTPVTSRAVVLATGGLGQVFATTSNPRGATGDGIALALRAGAVVGDAEFVQFHPTLLWSPDAGGPLPLVTEALRGAGAVLLDGSGRPLMAGVHPLGDLAPRDVVAARLHESLQSGDASHALLDGTTVPALARDFPGVVAACAAIGVDPTREPIPVVPGAHYHCGGVRAGVDGSTDVPGLLAVGEVAWTGMHGANRLASNSLLEALATGSRAGARLAGQLRPPAGEPAPPRQGPGMSPDRLPRLRQLMGSAAGVSRDGGSLSALVTELDGLASPGPARTSAEVQAGHQLLAAMTVARGALLRRESRGSHRRRDFPAAAHRRNLLTSWRDGALQTAVEDEEASA